MIRLEQWDVILCEYRYTDQPGQMKPRPALVLSVADRKAGTYICAQGTSVVPPSQWQSIAVTHPDDRRACGVHRDTWFRMGRRQTIGSGAIHMRLGHLPDELIQQVWREARNVDQDALAKSWGDPLAQLMAKEAREKRRENPLQRW